MLAESTYPIGSSDPDATELALFGDPNVSSDDLRAAAEAVVSVKVTATKP